ncbi:MAG: UDP-N-acetylmuramoyl-L-alanine--D-glutamate ligase [Flavobacteriaceae bacterium]|nr:MAG: UDP-N-acetylmuramoyl-L-alanine--D-glutamate ligase [Flavobacteriaceae bacterium]
MQKIVILGGGESGVGTALLAKKMNFEVFVSDYGTIQGNYKAILVENDIAFEEEKHSEAIILEADVVMKSPGIPDNVSIVVLLLKKGISVISEIEFAGRYCKATVIGITGSNGKTTTTLLTHHILSKAGLDVSVAGNIGASFAAQIAASKAENYVLELSSFQLDGIVEFSPHIAIITNISPDHLDRYNYDFEMYVDSKFRITKNQTEKDYLIYDGDDTVIKSWLSKNKIRPQLLPFSLKEKMEKGAYLKGQELIIKLNGEEIIMNIKKIAIQGKHNIKNAMAAAMVAKLMKVRKQTIRESLEDFEGVEHRLEPVKKVNGVSYMNDSKATNVNATYYALECMKTPTVWIVGGVDKGNDYFDLMPLVREKVKAIVCLGVDNRKIKETFGNVVDLVIETLGAEEAVKVAAKIADVGDTVLLSPCCASFDLFENYEDRGNKFKTAVRNL